MMQFKGELCCIFLRSGDGSRNKHAASGSVTQACLPQVGNAEVRHMRMFYNYFLLSRIFATTKAKFLIFA